MVLARWNVQVEIPNHGKYPEIFTIEPLVQRKGMKKSQTGDKIAEFTTEGKKFKVEILEGNLILNLGRNEEKYLSPYRSFKCYPVEIVLEPDSDVFTRRIVYEIALVK